MSPSSSDQTDPAEDSSSDTEQRTEKAQLVSRLEELFHGIQTTIFAQEMAAQQQLQSIADVWAATDRYRAGGNGRDRELTD